MPWTIAIPHYQITEHQWVQKQDLDNLPTTTPSPGLAPSLLGSTQIYVYKRLTIKALNFFYENLGDQSVFFDLKLS